MMTNSLTASTVRAFLENSNGEGNSDEQITAAATAIYRRNELISREGNRIGNTSERVVLGWFDSAWYVALMRRDDEVDGEWLVAVEHTADRRVAERLYATMGSGA